MGFWATKFVHFLLHPLHFIAVLLLLAAALSALRWRGGARWTAGSAAALFALFGFTPFNEWLNFGLEQRVQPGAYQIDEVAGAIVLGGAAGGRGLAYAPDGVILNDSAERLTAIVALRERRPDLPILFTGGDGGVIPTDTPESEIVRRFLTSMGVDPASIAFETRSRTTYENALYSAELLADRPGPYLLVTSTWHMPRALGAFRHAGVDVIPYPVDYRTNPPSWSFINVHPGDRFDRLHRAFREFAGMSYYYVSGRSNAWYPDD